MRVPEPRLVGVGFGLWATCCRVASGWPSSAPPTRGTYAGVTISPLPDWWSSGASHIVVSGDSGGGNLTLAVTHKAKRDCLLAGRRHRCRPCRDAAARDLGERTRPASRRRPALLPQPAA